jgi:hypothetical protein
MRTGDVTMRTMAPFITRLTVWCFLAQFMASDGMAASYCDLIDLNAQIAQRQVEIAQTHRDIATVKRHPFTRLKKGASHVVRSTASSLTTSLTTGAQALRQRFNRTSHTSNLQTNVKENSQPVHVTMNTEYHSSQKHTTFKHRRQKVSPEVAIAMLCAMPFMIAGGVWYAMTPHNDFDAVYFDVYKNGVGNSSVALYPEGDPLLQSVGLILQNSEAFKQTLFLSAGYVLGGHHVPDALKEGLTNISHMLHGVFDHGEKRGYHYDMIGYIQADVCLDESYQPLFINTQAFNGHRSVAGAPMACPGVMIQPTFYYGRRFPPHIYAESRFTRQHAASRRQLLQAGSHTPVNNTALLTQATDIV